MTNYKLRITNLREGTEYAGYIVVSIYICICMLLEGESYLLRGVKPGFAFVPRYPRIRNS